ncbi:MAG: MFS transporter [Burkholderiales bacterium]|nr:MFS transporter [Burkholderiales bacterium]
MQAGIYLGLVQLLFVTTWTVYVLFLPELARAAGIAPRWVAWILIADQLIFAAMDLALGMAAGRVAHVVGRLGRWIALVGAMSCAAFIGLPFASGSSALLVLIIVWAVSASVLRVPPLLLLSRYAAPAATPWIASLALLGIGLAGALAPLLTINLRGVDARLPFALAGGSLMVAVAAMGWCERHLALAAAAVPARAAPVGPPQSGVVLLAAVFLIALGIQVHIAINSGPLYLRQVGPGLLDMLMPSFWVGFALLVLPAAWLIRAGEPREALVIGAAGGAVCLTLLEVAPGLVTTVALQLGAGGAWALVFAAALNAALEAGRGAAGTRMVGMLFGALALATALRIGMAVAGWPGVAEFARVLHWLPPVAWAAAVILLLLVAGRAQSGSGLRT